MKIIDSTLREGRQSIFFNTIFNIQDKYLDIISKMGVADIEYRNPSVNEDELQNYRRLRNKYPNLKFHVHVFLSKTNIDWVIKEPSVEYISTFVQFPINKVSIDNLLYLIHNTPKAIRIGIENVTQVSTDDLKYIINLLKNEPTIDRIAFLDTLGRLTPDKTKDFLKQIDSIGLNNKAIEFHLHNDYGLAASNAIELLSIKDKTIYFSTSMFGIGERNGILSYGDLISNLIRLEVPHNLNLTAYGELVRLMEDNDINFNRDPISSNSFSHFASSHIIGEIGTNKYHNISPEQLGMKAQFIFNNLTGKDVFNQVASKILGKQIPKEDFMLRDYIIMKMKDQNVSHLYLEDVIKLLSEAYAENIF